MVEAARGIRRQQFLRGLLAAGALPALGSGAEGLESLVHAVTRGGQVGTAEADAYASITAQHRGLYWTAPARALLPSTLAHTGLGTDLLRESAEPVRRVLAGSVAESALLSARLAFFDLQQPGVAQRCFDVASAAVRDSANHALAAAVLAHMSFVPGFAGEGASAQPLLDAARGHARYEAGPLLRSWLHCVQAEVSARTGAVQHSVQHARQAEDSLSTAGTDPAWLDFFDAARLAGFLGYSHLVAGRLDDARASLGCALDQLDGRATKQRSVVLLDLAAAHADTDADQALAYAGEAFDQLQIAPYATAHDRIAGVRQALVGTPHLRVLDERMRALASPAL